MPAATPGRHAEALVLAEGWASGRGPPATALTSWRLESGGWLAPVLGPTHMPSEAKTCTSTGAGESAAGSVTTHENSSSSQLLSF